MKIIIFNACPDSGKDIAKDLLSKKRVIIPFSFKSGLLDITLSIYNIPKILWNDWYSREGKELPRSELGGLSCRQTLIKVSEEIIKPNYGKDFFGKRESNYVKSMNTYSGITIGVSSDGGFNEEIVPLGESFGWENIYIVRIERPGRNWDGDSRSWIDLENVPDENYITILNDGTLEEFHLDILDTYDYIVKK